MATQYQCPTSSVSPSIVIALWYTALLYTFTPICMHTTHTFPLNSFPLVSFISFVVFFFFSFTSMFLWENGSLFRRKSWQSVCSEYYRSNSLAQERTNTSDFVDFFPSVLKKKNPTLYSSSCMFVLIEDVLGFSMG